MSHVTSRFARATLGALVGALVLILATSAAAIHGNAEFELDADATDGMDPREDWATHFPEGMAPGGTAFATFFSAEPAGDDDTYFTTGGSKDVNDVPLWRHDPNAGSTDKNEITNGYAAMYLQGSDRLIFFGADRFAQNGNSAIGFWFFQNPISPDPVGPNGSGTFTGQHTDGDILVLSDFVNGGSSADLQIYEWSAGALSLLDESAACDAAHGLAEACARVNDVGIVSPWPYQPKSGPAGIIPATGFFEAGINLDFFFGAEEVPCFTQFLTTTRTSQSTTSQFKDFVLGDFETCKLRISITPQDADNDVGTTHDFTVLVEIDRGFGWEPAEGADVTAAIDSGPGSFVGNNTCQTGADGTCTVTITSDTAGTTTVSASAVFETGSTTLEAATDEANEGEGGTGPATKNWIKLASTTTTTPTESSIVLGGSVADQVTVSGALGTPTGTVSFFVCAPGELDANGLCSAGGTFLSAEDLVDGEATSASVTPTHAGTWCFRGEYSGDDTYEPSTDSSVGECFEVTPGPSSTTTTPTDASIVLGGSVADTAVVTGLGGSFPSPTGTVSFFVCAPGGLDANGLCSTGGTFISTEDLVDGAATSASFTPTHAGTWCLRGEYSGDANYQPSTDFAANECFDVTPAASDTTTTPTADTIVLGETVSDQVVVTGLGDGFPTPTGTVSFFVCGPGELDADGLCSTGGTFLSTNALSDGAATSTPFAPDHTGTWCLRGEYSGDANYQPSTDFAANECFDVTPAASETTTTPTDATIALGGSVADQVVVSGLGDGFPTPTGTVSFFVCGPGELDGDGLCSTGGTPVSAEELTDGAATSAAFTPDHTGTWCFRGEYSGDANYQPSTDFAANECFDVTPGASDTTTTPTAEKVELGGTIADQVVVSGLGEGFPTPTGSVDFFLCDPSALDANGLCSAGGTFLSTEDLVDGAATSDPFTIPKDDTLTGTWCFRGEYSGDTNYQPSTDFAANECFVVVGPISNLTKAVRVLPDGTFGPGASASPGDALEYLLNYTNEGEGAATDVTLTEEVPPHSTFVACSNGCTVSGDGSPGTLLTWSLGAVNPGESVLVTFEVVLDGEFPAGETPISNIASFDTAEEPPGDSNEVIVVVTAWAELFIEKAANRTGVMPGGAITYTLAFGNTGNATATEATVTETLPPGTSFDSCSDGCTVSGSTVTWDVAPLAPGETGSVTLSVVFDGLEACEVCNVATIGSPQDPESPRESNQVCIRIGANPAGANTSGNATGLQVSDTVLALTIVRSEAGSSQSGIGENSAFDRVQHIDVTGDGSLAVADLFTTRTTNVVSGDSLDASTTSIAEAAGVDLLDGAITASTVRAVATATASGTTATTSSAGTVVEGLRVLGEPVAALSPGERLELPAAVFGEGSYLAVGETVTAVGRPDGLVGGTYAATTTVRGLVVHVTGIPLVMEALDIVVSEAIARADFPQTPLCEDESAQAVAGHATVLEVGPLSVGRVELASTGGDEERNVTEVDATDVLLSGAETRTTGFITPDVSEAESTAHAEDLCILPEIGPGGTCVLAATTVRSEAHANANASGAEASGDAFLEGLFIDGVDQCAELGIDLCRPMPNTVLFDVPGTLFVVLNEQVPDPASPDGAGLTVRALRAVLLDGAEIIVAETHAAASFTVPSGAVELTEEGGFLDGLVPELLVEG